MGDELYEVKNVSNRWVIVFGTKGHKIKEVVSLRDNILGRFEFPSSNQGSGAAVKSACRRLEKFVRSLEIKPSFKYFGVNVTQLLNGGI